MKLRVYQGEGDIEVIKDRYREFLRDATEFGRVRAEEMLRLLDRLEAAFPGEPNWCCHTSHELLALHRAPDDDRVLVQVYATGDGPRFARAQGIPPDEAGCFAIEYVLPPDQSPWPEAQVHMLATSVSDALQALKIAFERCACNVPIGMPPRLNLVVIRSTDIEAAVHFYEVLGLRFTCHSHASGPRHYASEDPGCVFEIYPLRQGEAPTTSARLGFQVASVDHALNSLLTVGGKLVSTPKLTSWGYRAVIEDFDGHRVELTSPALDQ
jgi:predicted enzyme related to lactoylglutathione lyase